MIHAGCILFLLSHISLARKLLWIRNLALHFWKLLSHYRLQMRIAVVFHCVLFQSAGSFDAVIICMEKRCVQESMVQFSCICIRKA